MKGSNLFLEEGTIFWKMELPYCFWQFSFMEEAPQKLRSNDGLT